MEIEGRALDRPRDRGRVGTALTCTIWIDPADAKIPSESIAERWRPRGLGRDCLRALARSTTASPTAPAATGPQGNEPTTDDRSLRLKGTTLRRSLTVRTSRTCSCG